jgi:hypothetical protein
MPLRRRRPLMAAAMVGGVAHHAAKKGAEAGAEQAAEQAAQQAPPAAPPAAAGGMSPEAMEQLKQLAELHTQGVLTDAEFEVQKQKILQG